jgi:UDP-N-acetylmuramoylalanine-D-glutamate ligase
MSSQAQLGDDDLFGEAAAEMRADVEEHLDAARAELPAPDEVWETDADNVLGVLNGLKSSLDVGDARDELRQAKKWYVIGSRAEAFDDADDLEESITELEELVETVTEAREQVSELTGAMPQLRSALQDAADATEEAEEAEEAEEEEEEEEEE